MCSKILYYRFVSNQENVSNFLSMIDNNNDGSIELGELYTFAETHGANADKIIRNAESNHISFDSWF